MLKANSTKDTNGAARAAKKYLTSIGVSINHAQALTMAARMCEFKNHMVHAAVLNNPGTESDTAAPPLRIFGIRESQIPYIELQAANWTVDLIVPANPYNVGDSEMLTEEISLMLTGEKYALEDFTFEVANHYYDRFHVALRVTGTIASPGDFWDLQGAAEEESDEPVKVTLRVADDSHSFWDYDVIGHGSVRRVTVSKFMKRGDTFNLYHHSGAKSGATWLGSLEASLKAALDAVDVQVLVPVDPKDWKLFAISVKAKLADGTERQLRNGVGPWIGVDAHQEFAEACAIEESWSDELMSAKATPIVETYELPRYLVCHSWDHIFVGKRGTNTRWVLDAITNELIAAQAESGPCRDSYENLSKPLCDDLLESLMDNDVVSSSELEDFASELPEWAIASSASSSH